jgi:WD40 repeat protein
VNMCRIEMSSLQMEYQNVRVLVGRSSTVDWKLKVLYPFSDLPFCSFCRYLAIGSSEGDISIVDAANLSVCQKLKRAHMIFVTSMEFSPNGRAILSVSADSSARVTAVEPVRRSSWQGSLLVVIVGEIFFMDLASSFSRLSRLSP